MLSSAPTVPEGTYWTCPMHPDVHEQADVPCPSCGMKLAARTDAPEAPEAPTARTVRISAARQQLVGVKTSPVAERALEKEMVAAGTLASDETRIVEVESPVTGVVEQVLGNPIGQKVRRGEPLLVVATETGEKVTLKANATGHISWRIATVGTRIGPDSKVCTIYDHAGIWVWVEIYEADIPWLKTGQPATMTVPAYPGRTFEGRVTQISPLLQPDTHTLKVRVDFANSGFLLKPGMSAVVRIVADTGTRLALPESAVMRTGTDDVVFVAAGDGAFDVRDVTLGLRVGGWYEVVDGVVAGEQVVTSANFLVDSEARLQGVRDAWDRTR